MYIFRVIQCLPYGLPADVYSFGMCMWEVFEGTPCKFLSPADICSGVGTSNNSNNGSGRRHRSASRSIRPAMPVSYFNDTEYDDDNSNNSDDNFGADDSPNCSNSANTTHKNSATKSSTKNNNKNKSSYSSSNSGSNSGSNIGIGMPKQLQQLLQRCWNDDQCERPTFDEISNKLKLLLSELLNFHNNDVRKKKMKHGSRRQNHHSRNKGTIIDGITPCPPTNTNQQQYTSSLVTAPDDVTAITAVAEEAFWYRLETIIMHSS